MNRILLSAGLFLLTASVIMLTPGCQSDDSGEKKDAKKQKEQKAEKKNKSEKEDQVQRYYQIPSPDEMFAFIKQSGFEYDPSLTNPLQNKNNYVEPLKKTLNFGVYTADLAYTAAFEEYQSSVKYFGVVKTMADDIGIGSAFNKELVERVQKNLDNADSLVKVTSESYYKTVQYLEKNKRGQDLAVIAAGGWLESLYIVMNLAGEYEEGHPANERIAAQQLTLMNLMAYLMQYQGDADVAATIEKLDPVQKAFEKIETNKDAKTTMEKKDGKLVLGGGSEVSLTEAHFNELKDIVNQTRNNITGTNAN